MRQSVNFLTLLALCVAAAADLAAQQKPVAPPADYSALLERAAQHEAKALDSPVPYEFHERLTWSWGSETRSVIETPEGRADRIIYFRDEPLQPDQQEKQRHRLEKLLRDRDAVKAEFQDEKSETQRRIKMVKAFPKAVLIEFAGHENGLLRFAFRPNPEFSPKDRETQLYRGMEGFVWLEPVQERIVRVAGKLVKDVSFGWAIVGHLNKGGIYEIGQTEVAPGVWRITTLNVDVKGRLFLVNGFRFFRAEKNTSFQPTPRSMTYRSALLGLLAMNVPLPSPEQDQRRPGTNR
jgi:hypothetical protein